EDGALAIRFEYNTDLFDAATIERMVAGFSVLLREVAEDPSCPLARLPVMAPEDRARVLAKWSRSETAPPPRCLHGLFEAQARLTPQAIALEWGDQSVSYGEL